MLKRVNKTNEKSKNWAIWAKMVLYLEDPLLLLLQDVDDLKLPRSQDLYDVVTALLDETPDDENIKSI
jgi:hypothetical protein